jgi:hypothetical protein
MGVPHPLGCGLVVPLGPATPYPASAETTEPVQVAGDLTLAVSTSEGTMPHPLGDHIRLPPTRVPRYHCRAETTEPARVAGDLALAASTPEGAESRTSLGHPENRRKSAKTFQDAFCGPLARFGGRVGHWPVRSATGACYPV